MYGRRSSTICVVFPVVPRVFARRCDALAVQKKASLLGAVWGTKGEGVPPNKLDQVRKVRERRLTDRMTPALRGDSSNISLELKLRLQLPCHRPLAIHKHLFFNSLLNFHRQPIMIGAAVRADPWRPVRTQGQFVPTYDAID